MHKLRLATIAALINDGHTRASIAEHLDLDRATIRYTLTRYAPDLAEAWAGIPDGRRGCLDDIRHLADMGYRVDGIAQRLGVKPDSVKRRLQRAREWGLLDQIRTNHQPGREPHKRDPRPCPAVGVPA